MAKMAKNHRGYWAISLIQFGDCNTVQFYDFGNLKIMMKRKYTGIKELMLQ